MHSLCIYIYVYIYKLVESFIELINIKFKIVVTFGQTKEEMGGKLELYSVIFFHKKYLKQIVKY